MVRERQGSCDDAKLKPRGKSRHVYALADENVTTSVLETASLQQRGRFSMLTPAQRRFIKAVMAPGAIMSFKWGIE